MQPAATDYVFIHGGASGAWKWDPTVEALRELGGERVGRILAVDFPGCGTKRDWDVSRVTHEDEVALALRETEEAGIRDAVLVGHSLAGIALPQMVIRRPEFFRRSVFVCCVVPEEGESAFDLLGPQNSREDPEHLGFPAHVLGRPAAEMRDAMWSLNPMPADWTGHPWGGTMDTITAQEIMRRTLGEKRSPLVRTAKASRRGFHGLRPVTYIVALRDASMTVGWQQRFIDRLGASAVERLELDAGHNCMVTHPRELAALLLLCAR